MRVEDLAFLLAGSDRPGRSLLRVSAESPFFATTTTEDPAGSGLLRVTLPTPPSGFVRLWSLLLASLSTNVATDSLSLNFDTIATNQVLSARTGAAINLADQIPMVGSSLITLAVPTIALTSPRAAFAIEGIDPFIVGQESIILFGVITTGSGQSLTGRGRYLDLPI
jgi:hypothetical protein